MDRLVGVDSELCVHGSLLRVLYNGAVTRDCSAAVHEYLQRSSVPSLPFTTHSIMELNNCLLAMKLGTSQEDRLIIDKSG